MIAVSGYHLQAGASFSRHVISIIELSFRSLEFLWPDWGRGWGILRKLTGRYIITGSRSINRKRRRRKRRKVEGSRPTSWAASHPHPDSRPWRCLRCSQHCFRPLHQDQRSGCFLFSQRDKYLKPPATSLWGISDKQAFWKIAQDPCCNALTLWGSQLKHSLESWPSYEHCRIKEILESSTLGARAAWAGLEIWLEASDRNVSGELGQSEFGNSTSAVCGTHERTESSRLP